jgi:hypothetical protein
VNRVTIPRIKDFYDENSHSVLKDLTMAVFGVNVGPTVSPHPHFWSSRRAVSTTEDNRGR